MSFFKRLTLAFKYDAENLEAVMVEINHREEQRRRKLQSHQVQLCVYHQPRNPGAFYAEHNCDHCNALKALGRPLPTEKDRQL